MHISQGNQVTPMDAIEKVPRPPRRRIYLLRHGDVSYFDPQGRPFRPTTVPLNAEGRLQAEAAARLLADVPLDRAAASDLPRSTETVNVILAGRPLPLQTFAEFR